MSPSKKSLYVEYRGFKKVFAAYQRECLDVGEHTVSKGHLYNIWRLVAACGVVHPETGVRLAVKIRHNRAEGFGACPNCEQLKYTVRMSKDPDTKKGYVKMLNKHLQSQQENRAELDRVKRLCKVDPQHVGVFVDAVDKNKFGIPTTESASKTLSGIQRIKQKITGVQFFSSKKLLFFRTLPDVPTGGNLTMTILEHLFSDGHLKNATDLHINLDGAADNICYTVFYGLAKLLRDAGNAGWPLLRIHLYRFDVGHTHNELDAAFGNLSIAVYGKNGNTPMDILSFASFERICKEVYGERLLTVIDIRAVHDWDRYVRGYRPPRVDQHIQTQHGICFERCETTVYVKSKAVVRASVPWSRNYQMLPHPAAPDAHIQPRTEPPTTAPSRHWENLTEKVVPSLLKFYLRRIVHPVHIPDTDRYEMFSFLQNGPSAHIPPAWIQWGDHMPDEIPAPVPAPPPLSRPRRKRVWKPFLSTSKRKRKRGPVSKKCRCGSTTHKTIRARVCPLNPANLAPRIPDREHAPEPTSSESGDESKSEFDDTNTSEESESSQSKESETAQSEESEAEESEDSDPVQDLPLSDIIKRHVGERIQVYWVSTTPCMYVFPYPPP